LDDWIEQYVKRLEAAHVATPTTLIGCTPAEVDELEAEFGLRLPGLYRAMLLRFGKAAGRLIDRSEMDFYYDAILAMNRRLRGDGLHINLPKRAFAIRGRYDEQFEFVCDSPAATDSPVHYVNEDPEGKPTPGYNSITDWLDCLLDDARGPAG
jgi:hypothetical protein